MHAYVYVFSNGVYGISYDDDEVQVCWSILGVVHRQGVLLHYMYCGVHIMNYIKYHSYVEHIFWRNYNKVKLDLIEAF